ncbi:MAG: Stp1/IreP family PP2C-type Ser/Thr phosphatase [Clostridia bacterium]|nr:Stp1/IreP family PP2C-type Ser/Thr phosphatase [Clostridia bacterium]
MMRFYGISDIGKSRKENQDRIYLPTVKNELKYFIIADGMGGVNGGEVASTAAVEVIKDYIDANVENINFDDYTIENLIYQAILAANKFIYNKSLNQKEYKGMGTTIVLAILYRNRVYIGHVGDSRIYRIRKNIIRQLTKDHSYVQALLDQGTITREEAENHPQKNILMKVVGCERKLEPDILVKGFIKDDILLMCTDGLTNMVSTNEIYDTIVNGKNDLSNTCKKLIDMANENGGYDNVSVILISKD